MSVHRTAVLIPVLLAGMVFAGSARAGSVELSATLILASNEQSAQDPRLEKIEYKLRPLFRFEYYRFCGSGSATLNLPGETTMSVGQDSKLQISADDAGNGRVRANVRWLRGNDVVLNTTVVMGRGTPIILGGISEGSGKLIITLTMD